MLNSFIVQLPHNNVYWTERRSIRSHLQYAFTKPYIDSQLFIHCPKSHVRQTFINDFLFKPLIDLCLTSPTFAIFINHLCKLDMKSARALAMFVLTDDSVQLNPDILPSLSNNNFTNDTLTQLCIQTLASYNIPLTLGSVTSETQKPWQVASSSQLTFSGMHYTERHRLDDGTLFLLSDDAMFRSPSRPMKAHFAGGSLGYTAMDFLLLLPEEAQKMWDITVTDLYSPQEIFTRMGGPGHFSGFSQLNYIRADLTQPPFEANTFDFIDATNSIGYITEINSRLNVVIALFQQLRVGGYLRLTVPNYELMLEQVIFQKTGTNLNDWQLKYVSFRGKTVQSCFDPNQTSQEIFTINLERTKRLLQLINAYRNNVVFDLTPGPDKPRAFLQDMCALSPFTFGVGVGEDLMTILYNEPSFNYDKYFSSRESYFDDMLTHHGF